MNNINFVFCNYKSSSLIYLNNLKKHFACVKIEITKQGKENVSIRR